MKILNTMYTEHRAQGPFPSFPPVRGLKKEEFAMSEEARAARREYMKRYRQTPQGREKLQAAQERYWTRRFAQQKSEKEAAK